ncbi:helix-turn-helix domain-containing protein [Brucella abortus]|nr:transcriptional regulator [Brucella melitensis]ASU71241.1 transcriptional regulator [Brucella abortus]ASZ29036.1 XRE family transcriptional regulator [Brucella melitensis]ASZ86008.1 XRE family transcriptional regulator [Brucella abortus]ASZ88834.1 XRE family transcriptional regulator [Brucella abortus]
MTGEGEALSERKIFVGPRIRRIRNERGLTQTAMAEALGISPSYLNLIERN